MKPLILTLHAIGPYAATQVIDFRPVLDSGLFGIYGATGSGKSTIFSAMTFALFGEAARAEQHATSLRSDHADPGHMTQVELIFEAGAHTYRVVRQPEQVRPTKRGSGETSDKHKAWLFDVTGMDLDQINDGNPGKFLAGPKVMLVDEAIKKLLGYGAAQFRQIVLLPQGRFEAFLSADTKARLEILRDLFDVSLYRRLAERLKTQSDTAEKQVAAARAGCAARLAAESFTTMEALEEGIADARHHHRDLQEVANTAKAGWVSADAVYHAAVQTDALFRQHAEAEAEHAQLLARRQEMDAVEVRLAAARVAASLADVAAARDEGRREALEARQRLAQSTERLQLAETQAATAHSKLAVLLEKSVEIEKHKSTLQTFRAHERQLSASEVLKAATAAAERDVRDRTDQLQKAKSALDALASQRERSAKALLAAQSAAVKRAQFGQAAAELTARHAAAAAFDDAAQKLRTSKATLDTAQADLEMSEQQWQGALLAHAAAEKALLQDHSAHLTAHLVPGEPCLLCGSLEHPAPARAPAGERIEKDYATAKTNLEKAQTVAAKARTRLEVAQQAWTDRTAVLQGLAPPVRTAAEIAAELQHVHDEIQRLGPPLEPDALQSDLDRLDENISSAAAALERARQDCSDASNKAVAAAQSLSDALATVPHDLQDPPTLLSAIKVLESAIAAFVRDLEAATQADRDAAIATAAAVSQKATVSAELARLELQQTQRETEFNTRLSEHGLTAADYDLRKADVPAIPTLEATVREYTAQKAAAEARLLRATQIIASLARPDLASVTSARDAAATEAETAQAAVATASARLAQLLTLQTDLAAEGQRLNALEKETAPLRELAEAFSGRTYQKIDLETFAISALFDRVLDSANLRLAPMTRGRYSLVREAEGRGNARRGLGIAVEDTYTGRQRSTATLSGGETFIAALALALGLSDIVESAHGNVRLDTIFIDEGFGSLDSDGDSGTLETVLQTLQDIVGASRSVGLISHVPLVQQAIPNGFFVFKTPAGSHVEVRT